LKRTVNDQARRVMPKRAQAEKEKVVAARLSLATIKPRADRVPAIF